MVLDRTKSGAPDDDSYWSALAEYLERRDRGEEVDPDQFAARFPGVAERLRSCLAGFHWLEGALSGSGSKAGDLGVSEPPRRLGEYRIVREIGRGGMGVVYEAVHEGLDRRVALKVLFDAQFRDETARRRFVREARTAAALHHTHIVPVFDVGSADGHLYFAMQLIHPRRLPSASASTDAAAAGSTETTGRVHGQARGEPAGSARRDPFEVARLGLQAAEALAYAHARGVVHRDIKPSNLLVDESGTLWVTDFGLAFRRGDDSMTASSATIGTPRYMSPEQAAAAHDMVDERSDVYSLGVTLYEWLTGRPAFDMPTAQQLLIGVIRGEPVRPRQLDARIPRDLETIVLRAMAKRRGDRYASAAELADDLRRLLEDQPIRARRIGPIGRLVRWCRREPRVAGVTIAAAVVIAVLSAAFHWNLAAARRRAIDNEQIARVELAESLLDQARVVSQSPELGNRWRALDLLHRSAAIRRRPDLSVEALRALGRYDVRLTRALTAVAGAITAGAFSADSARLAIASESAQGSVVRIVRVLDGSVDRELPMASPVHWMEFSAAGDCLAGAGESGLFVWDLASRQLRMLPGKPPRMSTVAFSAGGEYLAGWSGGLRLWNAADGTAAATLFENDTRADSAGAMGIGLVAFSGDGRVLIAASDRRHELIRVSLRDRRVLEPLRWAPESASPRLPVLALAGAPRGPLVAAACGDERVRIWHAESGELLGTLAGHRAPVSVLAWSADGDTLLSSDGFELRLWDAMRGIELAVLPVSGTEFAGTLGTLAWSPDGRWLLCGDRSAQLAELARPGFHGTVVTAPRRVSSIDVSGSGRHLAWTAEALCVLDTQSGESRRLVELDEGDDGAVLFHPERDELLLARRFKPGIQLWDAASGRQIDAWQSEGVVAAAWHPDGRRVALAEVDGRVRLWDVATGEARSSFDGQSGPITSLAFNRDGTMLAASVIDRGEGPARTVFVWDVAGGGLVRSMATGSARVAFSVAFDPATGDLVGAGVDGVVRVWDVGSGELRAEWSRGRQPIRRVAVSGDGGRLAACAMDGRVLVWDLRDRRLFAELGAQRSGSLTGVVMDRSGRIVWASGGPREWLRSGSGSVEVWDLRAAADELSALGLVPADDR